MMLGDITNTNPCARNANPLGSQKVVKKRLSDGTVKTFKYPCARRQLELTFENDSAKLAFECKLDKIRKSLGCRSVKETVINMVSNWDLQNCNHEQVSSGNCHHSRQFNSSETSTAANNFHVSHVLPDHFSQPEQVPMPEFTYDHFICQAKAIMTLTNSVAHHQMTCRHLLMPREVSQNGHVIIVTFACQDGHTLHWSSSEAIGNQYEVNYRIMLAYLCSGITPVQYERFADFADVGKLTEHFRAKFLIVMHPTMELLKRQSIYQARAEEMALSGCNTITIMTDARHACRKNSHHTDHVSLGMKTHKVVDIQHVNKTDDRVSQRHETIGVSRMYDDFDKCNINVDVHVHDNNASINKAIRSRVGTTNCNERWHATRPITAGLRKIGQGAKKNENKTWHPELGDKGALVRNHVYYALDHCDGSATKLRSIILNCVKHFQNIHDECDPTSECKTSGYVPSFTIITSPVAQELLEKFLKTLTVYKQAENYVLSKNTYYVESFNNTCLIYLDKRIHYHDKMYEIRSWLSVLDWNEHVDRPYTSIYRCLRAEHPRQHGGKKVYKRKTYKFVQDIWELLLDVMRCPEDPKLNDCNMQEEISDSEEGNCEKEQEVVDLNLEEN